MRQRPRGFVRARVGHVRGAQQAQREERGQRASAFASRLLRGRGFGFRSVMMMARPEVPRQSVRVVLARRPHGSIIAFSSSAYADTRRKHLKTRAFEPASLLRSAGARPPISARDSGEFAASPTSSSLMSTVYSVVRRSRGRVLVRGFLSAGDLGLLAGLHVRGSLLHPHAHLSHVASAWRSSSARRGAQARHHSHGRRRHHEVGDRHAPRVSRERVFRSSPARLGVAIEARSVSRDASEIIELSPLSRDVDFNRRRVCAFTRWSFTNSPLENRLY